VAQKRAILIASAPGDERSRHASAPRSERSLHAPATD